MPLRGAKEEREKGGSRLKRGDREVVALAQLACLARAPLDLMHAAPAPLHPTPHSSPMAPSPQPHPTPSLPPHLCNGVCCGGDESLVVRYDEHSARVPAHVLAQPLPRRRVEVIGGLVQN